MFTFASVDLSSSDRCSTSIIGLAYFLYLFIFSGKISLLVDLHKKFYYFEKPVLEKTLKLVWKAAEGY